MSAVERFAREARRLGFNRAIRRYPDGTRTAEDAAHSVGCEVGQIVKSLVFVADGEPIVALTSGSNRVDTGALGAVVGAIEVRRATADEARAATGFAIGGTPPFGHERELRVYVDRDLLGYDSVWAAAGTPDSVFEIPPDELVRASSGTVADFRQG